MREILSTKDNRLIHIIEILVSSNWVSLGELATELNCSEKTVRNDLSALTAHYPDIKIETSNALGYRLIKGGSYTNENPADDVINDTLIAQITLLLLKKSNLRSVDIEDELYVTANSIRTAINQFNDFFDIASNVAIQSRPFQIIGDEITITALLSVRSLERYLKKDPLYAKEFFVLDKLIDHLFTEDSDLKAAFADNRYVLNLIFYIRFYREFNQHSVPTKPEYQFRDYAILDDKFFRDEFFSAFEIPLEKNILNSVINFSLFELSTVSYLRMTYLFPAQTESARLRNTVRQLLTAVAKRLNLPVLDDNQLRQLLAPRTLPKSKLTLDYELYDFSIQILRYELAVFLTAETNFQLRSLYELYVIPELAAMASSEWLEFKNKLASLDLTMIVGFDLIASQQHYLMHKSFFEYYKDSRIVLKDITALPNDKEFDLLITNLKIPRSLEGPIINLASLPRPEHSQKLQTFYTDFKLAQYLNYELETSVNDD